MFKCFYPDQYLDSTYQINFEQLYAKGFRGILFDIDNTLVPHGAPADERAKALFIKLKELGFGYCFVSNNKKDRVEPFCEETGGCCVYKAGKPSLSEGFEASGHRPGEYPFYRRSAFYRYLRCKEGRTFLHSCEADPSQRRDPDRS